MSEYDIVSIGRAIRTNKEILAVSALDRALSRTDYLEPDISRGDRGPSWDGAVYVYEKPGHTHPKADLIGRVPVQVKGHATTRVNKEKIKFPVEVSDLRNYLRDGGAIYFVVYLDENTDKERIYFKRLLPFDLKRLLKEVKSQKTKMISLIPFPSDKKEITELFLNFVKDMKKQKPDSAIEKIYSIEELEKQGATKELSFSFTTIGPKNPVPIQYLLDHGVYLYAQTKEGISFPVEYIENVSGIIEKRKGTIRIAGQTYYEEYEVIRKKEVIQLRFGKSMIYTAHLSDQTASIKFRLNGTLSQRISDCKFLLALVEHRQLFINDYALAKLTNGNFVGYDSDSFKKLLDDLIMVQNALNAFNVQREIDIDNMDKSDSSNLSRFIFAFKGNEVPLADTGMPFGCYRIGNFKILISVVKNEETKRFKITNFFAAPYRLFYEDNNKKWMLPLFVALKKQDLMDYCNISKEGIKKQILEMEYNPIMSEYVLYFLLDALNAYDTNPIQYAELLEVADVVIEAMKLRDRYTQPDIIRINELQIIKRKRQLNSLEIDELKKMLKNEDISVEMKVEIYLLLDAFTEAMLYFEDLSAERQKEFAQYPIYNFMPRDDA